MKAIKIGDLREESNRLGREITAMQKRKKAVDIMIEVYAPAKAVRKARAVVAPVVVATLDPAPPPTPVPVKRVRGEYRPTGYRILEAFKKTPNSCMTRPQIAAAIGYSWASAREKQMVVASVSNLVASKKLKINAFGLYCLGVNA